MTSTETPIPLGFRRCAALDGAEQAAIADLLGSALAGVGATLATLGDPLSSRVALAGLALD